MKNLLKFSEVTDAGRSPQAIYIESDREKFWDIFSHFISVLLFILSKVTFLKESCNEEFENDLY